MTGLSTSERMRKAVCGVCLILAPAGLLIGMIMHPRETTNPTEQLQIVSADPGRWAAAHWILTVSAILLVGAVLGLAHLVHERRPGEAIVGGAIGVIGAMALCAVALMEAMFVSELGRVTDQGAIIPMFTTVMTGAAFMVVLIGVLLGPLAAIVLGNGVLRARIASAWAPVCMMLGGLCVAVGLPTNVRLLTIIGSVLLLAGMGYIGTMILGESDEEWVHTPVHSPMAH